VGCCLEFGKGAFVLDDKIRTLAELVVGVLERLAMDEILIERAALAEPFAAECFGCDDGDDVIEQFLDTGAVDQRRFDDGKLLATSGELLESRGNLFKDARMNQALDELTAAAVLLGRTEQSACQRCTVNRSRPWDNCIAEFFRKRSADGWVMLYDLPCKCVARKDRNAASLHDVGDGAFAAADAARQTNREHRCWRRKNHVVFLHTKLARC
jgi:hypothetical protein